MVKRSTYNVMVMGMESSYTEENNGHVKKLNLQTNLVWLTEGLCANDWRINNKPSSHELAAHPLHSRDKKIKENADF